MKTYIVLFFAFVSFGLKAQHYGNEWINYAQNYYSFKVAQDGIYKIDYNTLINSGIPLSFVSSDNFQLFAFEKEQPIYIEDGGDNSIDNGDYILLYAQKNNTWLDSLLYENPDDIANKYVPHYSDTITYFLTWNVQTNHARINEETDINFNAYSANPYGLFTSSVVFDDYYSEGFKAAGLSYSQYVNGEGWSSVHINALSTPVNYLNANLITQFAYTGTGAPVVTGTAVSSSRSNASYTGTGNHHLKITNENSGQILVDSIFIGYQKTEVDFSFPATDINASITNIRHTFVNDQGAAADQQSVHYVNLTYPRLPNLAGSSYFEMAIVNGTGGKSRYDFTNFNASNAMAFAIGDDIKKIPVVQNASTFQVLVPNATTGQQKLIILDEGQVNDISSLTAINGNGQFTNYSNSNFNDAYIIVSHNQTWIGAQAYQNYRSSLPGGGHQVQLINISELDLQFGGGVPKHIMGLRRFLHFAYNQTATPPNHVFLIGKGIREAKMKEQLQALVCDIHRLPMRNALFQVTVTRQVMY